MNMLQSNLQEINCLQIALKSIPGISYFTGYSGNTKTRIDDIWDVSKIYGPPPHPLAWHGQCTATALPV